MSNDFIKTAVIGHPISHSKSPLIHRYWLEKHGLSGSYNAIDVPVDNLKQGVADIIKDGFSGFNVTIPHKISIMDICDEIDDLATAIGAVNTVTIKNGKLYGTNTDGFGFVENIKRSAADFDFKEGKAVVLGAGGAANAVIYALLQEGVPEIFIANRTKEKAQKLTAFNPEKIKAIDWALRNDVLEHANLIINTTSLGMAGHPPLDISLRAAPAHVLVTDIIYAPLITDLLKQAKISKLRTVTGIGMLLHQARPGFKLWNGVLPEVTEELEQLVLT
ncbi:MAG: shikimate dehydrogenase [Alphaproteobacteria bacterium]|nr:MAG: shikimate dehydrogenase [Alphaproteobacteria bacterium]